jgi:hypothetical protein
MFGYFPNLGQPEKLNRLKNSGDMAFGSRALPNKNRMGCQDVIGNFFLASNIIPLNLSLTLFGFGIQDETCRELWN